ncbi:MAG: hypothetical protein QW745_08720 [Thermoplasmata archaeon]
MLEYKEDRKSKKIMLCYSTMDNIEKIFLSLKSHLVAKSLMVKSKETVNVLLFINFIE